MSSMNSYVRRLYVKQTLFSWGWVKGKKRWMQHEQIDLKTPLVAKSAPQDVTADANAVAAFIDTLSDIQIEVLTRVIDEVDVPDIAQELDLTQNEVRMHRTAGLRKIRDRFKTA